MTYHYHQTRKEEGGHQKGRSFVLCQTQKAVKMKLHQIELIHYALLIIFNRHERTLRVTGVRVHVEQAGRGHEVTDRVCHRKL